MKLMYWSINLSRSRRGDVVKGFDGGYRCSSPPPVSLLEFMKIWCNIQVIVNPLSKRGSFGKMYSCKVKFLPINIKDNFRAIIINIFDINKTLK